MSRRARRLRESGVGGRESAAEEAVLSTEYSVPGGIENENERRRGGASGQVRSQAEPGNETPSPSHSHTPTPSYLAPGPDRGKFIYQQVVIQRRSQADVAKELGISQVRVSQILRQVKDRMDLVVPEEQVTAQLKQVAQATKVLELVAEGRLEDYGLAAKIRDQQLKEEQPRVALAAINTRTRIGRDLERAKWREEGKEEGERRKEEGRKQCEMDHGKWPMANRDFPLANDHLPLPIADPPPAELRQEDRALWATLRGEDQARVREHLAAKGSMPLAKALLGPKNNAYYIFPWRNYGEHLSAAWAKQVVDGSMGVEEYLRELARAGAYGGSAMPPMLAKDREGRWRVLTPEEVPQQPLPPERAALATQSPERVFWPFKSKGEYQARQRAQMVLAGLLTREQYESLSARLRRETQEDFPDPLAEMGEAKSAPMIDPRLVEGDEERGRQGDEETGRQGDGEPANASMANGQWEMANGQLPGGDWPLANDHLPLSIAEPAASHPPPLPHPHTPAPSHLLPAARRRLEYAFGRALSDADIAAALAHQRRVDRGLFVMDIFEPGQSEALRAWAAAGGGRRKAEG